MGDARRSVTVPSAICLSHSDARRADMCRPRDVASERDVTPAAPFRSILLGPLSTGSVQFECRPQAAGTIAAPSESSLLNGGGLTQLTGIVAACLLDGILDRSEWDAGCVFSMLERDSTDEAAFHTDLDTSMDRMTFSTPPPPSSQTSLPSILLSGKPMPTHRQKQIRVLLSVYGTPRLGPHKVSPQMPAIAAHAGRC